MGLAWQSADVVRFHAYEVHLRAGELYKAGRKIKLQAQPFQVLAMLLECPGEVVTREDLQKRLWAADTFVDFDHSLNTAIKRLRDALGDSADNPVFIETLSRRGYRFMAPMEQLENGQRDGNGAGSRNGHGVLNGNGGAGVLARVTGGATSRWSARAVWWGLAGFLITSGA